MNNNFVQYIDIRLFKILFTFHNALSNYISGTGGGKRATGNESGSPDNLGNGFESDNL